MTFVNDEQPNAHKKRHEIVLNLEIPKNNLMDQTPTPTLFLRNCEEVGLFQDLQNVNPFDDTFKKALEKSGPSQPPEVHSDDTLHTPNILPHITISTIEKPPANCELGDVSADDDEELIVTKEVVRKVARKRKAECDERRREVNRAAQHRSRMKKKEMSRAHERWTAELRRQNDDLLVENELLKDELRKARQILEKHKWCPITANSQEIISSVLMPSIETVNGIVIPPSQTGNNVAILSNTAVAVPVERAFKNVAVSSNSAAARSFAISETTAESIDNSVNSSGAITSAAVASKRESIELSNVNHSNLTSLNTRSITSCKSTKIPITPLKSAANTTSLKSSIPNSISSFNSAVVSNAKQVLIPAQAFVLQAVPVVQPATAIQIILPPAIGRNIVPKLNGFNETINSCGIESTAKKPRHVSNVNLLKRRS